MRHHLHRCQPPSPWPPVPQTEEERGVRSVPSPAHQEIQQKAHEERLWLVLHLSTVRKEVATAAAPAGTHRGRGRGGRLEATLAAGECWGGCSRCSGSGARRGQAPCVHAHSQSQKIHQRPSSTAEILPRICGERKERRAKHR